MQNQTFCAIENFSQQEKNIESYLYSISSADKYSKLCCDHIMSEFNISLRELRKVINNIALKQKIDVSIKKNEVVYKILSQEKGFRIRSGLYTKNFYDKPLLNQNYYLEKQELEKNYILFSKTLARRLDGNTYAQSFYLQLLMYCNSNHPIKFSNEKFMQKVGCCRNTLNKCKDALIEAGLLYIIEENSIQYASLSRPILISNQNFPEKIKSKKSESYGQTYVQKTDKNSSANVIKSHENKNFNENQKKASYTKVIRKSFDEKNVSDCKSVHLGGGVSSGDRVPCHEMTPTYLKKSYSNTLSLSTSDRARARENLEQKSRDREREIERDEKRKAEGKSSFASAFLSDLAQKQIEYEQSQKARKEHQEPKETQVQQSLNEKKSLKQETDTNKHKIKSEAKSLAEGIVSNHKHINLTVTECERYIEKVILEHKVSIDDVSDAVSWGLKDNFWQSRILSARSFYNNFLTIYSRMQMCSTYKSKDNSTFIKSWKIKNLQELKSINLIADIGKSYVEFRDSKTGNVSQDAIISFDSDDFKEKLDRFISKRKEACRQKQLLDESWKR